MNGTLQCPGLEIAVLVMAMVRRMCRLDLINQAWELPTCTVLRKRAVLSLVGKLVDRWCRAAAGGATLTHPPCHPHDIVQRPLLPLRFQPTAGSAVAVAVLLEGAFFSLSVTSFFLCVCCDVFLRHSFSESCMATPLCHQLEDGMREAQDPTVQQCTILEFWWLTMHSDHVGATLKARY